VLYLEQEGHLSRKDRQAVFEYWFDIMAAPERAGLRRYVARFGFERVAEALSAEATHHVAVYGSLREGFALPDAPDVRSALLDRGNCRIPGQLYDRACRPEAVRGPVRLRAGRRGPLGG